MTTNAAWLAAIAVFLAFPAPILLGRAMWPSRHPGAALALWQAIALAGGFAMIGSLAMFGLSAFGTDLVTGGLGLLAVLAGGALPAGVEFWQLICLCLAVLLTAHLLLTLGYTIARSELQRRRHAQLIALLTSPMASDPRTRVIDSPAPIAYCLPGPIHSVTVFSAGLITMLDAEQLTAVIEHEKAHAFQRHDIVLVIFRAWYLALPWFPIAERAQRDVGMLVEMLADDQARRYVSDASLAAAITTVGTSGVDLEPPRVSQLAVPTTVHLARRLSRLGSRPATTSHRPALVAAVALLAVTGALLLAPTVATFLT